MNSTASALDTNDAFMNTVIDPKTRFRQTPESRHQEATTIPGAKIAKHRVLVAGRLHASKTTLVNGAAVCGTTFESGRENIETEIPQSYLFLHDSAGFEAPDSSFRIVTSFLANRGLSRTFSERVHAIWYCICTDTAMRLAPGDFYFFDNDFAQQVPVIVVFTRYRGLVTTAFAELRRTLNRVESKEKRFEKARELLRLGYIDRLKALRFPPTAYVQIDDLLEDSTTLEHLIQTTLALMTEENLRPMVFSVRQNNLDPFMEAAVSAAFDAKDGSDLASCILRHYPHIWKNETYDEPVDLTRAMASLSDDHLARVAATCQSSLSGKHSTRDTSAYTKRADVIATLCICLEQTALESSASMADFPSAFNQAVDAYFAPNSVVRASVNKEISKLSPQDFRETPDPASDRPTRLATAKLVHIIKTHRLRLTT